MGQSKEQYRKMKEAEFIDLFGEGEIDFSEPMTYNQGNVIERLLKGSAITEGREREIHNALYNQTFNQFEAQECIDYLFKNQLDPVLSGNAYYSQGDIKNTLRTTIGNKE